MISVALSIISPCYNGEPFLEELYECLCREYSAGASFEWILIDDGSTDQSRNLLLDIAANSDFNCHIIQQEKKGACSARNAGLSSASGRYVKFLDVDDFFAEGHLTRAIINMEQSESSVWVTPIRHVHVTNAGKHRYMPERKIERMPIDLLARFLSAPFFHHSACFIPTDTARAVGGWDPTLRADQDGDFLSRLIQSGCRFNTLDGPPFYYRIHSIGDRISGSDSPEKIESRLKVTRNIAERLKAESKLDQYAEGIAIRLDRVAQRAWSVDRCLANQILMEANHYYPGYRMPGGKLRRCIRRSLGFSFSMQFGKLVNRLR